MGRNARHISPQAIVEVAARLFYANGYKNTSLEEVAKILQVTRPAIYHYFKSKEDIIHTIIQQVLEKVRAYAEEILAKPQPAHRKFEELLHRHILLILENKIEMGIFFEEQKNLPPHITQKTLRFIDEYYSQLTHLYREGVKTGHFIDKNPSLAVQTLFGACNWAYKWYNPSGTCSKEEVAQLILEMLMRGYRA
ncbi:MAG: hypothetical protein BAA01_10390 [Bacillus thermozeamaize]|uniref:HTH tetR-type domain-containing protein n=1 Tax=Bacillus thermozeamaize TaxID=230954 RepID=A0A1Y3PK59_9BACI|nr:MAG: hypothetical protein BAA01_10390 [Bacillus thermozeamaize]